MPRTLRLNVLGPFHAEWSDGTPLEVTGKKTQALMGYLAVESARPHTRDQLAGLLWSETGDERARHNLRQALSKIRRSHGPLISTSGDALTLDLTLCTTDVREFERLAGSHDIDELSHCIALYRGELLDGLVLREPVFDEWILGAQHRLRRSAYNAIERLAHGLIEAERSEEAIDVLNRRIAMDPACEPAHRHLMEVFARTGRRSDALRQYQFLSDALQRELGAEPSAETKVLHERIRDIDSTAGAPPAAPRKAAPASAEHELPGVAVLPFDNLSGPDDGYFVDGMTEDIITALSHFSSLLVISRLSTFAYRDGEASDQRIAEELGAQFLVRGSVRRAGDRVRINVQLIDAHAGSTLWAHRFDRELEDVFLVQDELTSTIVSTLAGRVEAARLAQARRAPRERLDAYDYVLRGKEHHHRYTEDDCRSAIEMFEHAVESDPDYAIAHAWLACGLGQAMLYRPDQQAELVDQAQRAAERGLELDETESECHRILGQVSMIRRNLDRAIRHQERGLFLNPNDDRSVCAMGEFLSFVGRSEEAEAWIRKAMKLNPYHPPRFWSHLARALFHQGRYEEASQALQNVRAPRVREQAFQVAARAKIGDAKALARSVAELREASPSFSADKFVDQLPYEHEGDREALREALQAAGF